MHIVILVSIVISWVYHAVLWIHFTFIVMFFSKFLQSDSNSNLTETINPVIGVFWMYSTLFLYCETGERVTHQFNQFSEKLCYSDWYLFPLEMQRMFIIMLCGTQEPTIIQGYANTVCTRDAFKLVWFGKDLLILITETPISPISHHPLLLFFYFRPFKLDFHTSPCYDALMNRFFSIQFIKSHWNEIKYLDFWDL